jgi:hypothetical protein
MQDNSSWISRPGHPMTWLRVVFALLGGISAASVHAQSPPLDNSPAFFAGDWIGTGAQDNFCFMRLRPDGSGTVLAMGAAGDWLGARIRWRNQHQNIVVMAVYPLPGDPRRRLAPLTQLSLSKGFGTTIQLKLNKNNPLCELQRRASVQRNMAYAEMLLNDAADGASARGGR